MTIRGAKLVQNVQTSEEVATVLASAGQRVDSALFVLCVFIAPADFHGRAHLACPPQNAAVSITL